MLLSANLVLAVMSIGVLLWAQRVSQSVEEITQRRNVTIDALSNDAQRQECVDRTTVAWMATLTEALLMPPDSPDQRAAVQNLAPVLDELRSVSERCYDEHPLTIPAPSGEPSDPGAPQQAPQDGEDGRDGRDGRDGADSQVPGPPGPAGADSTTAGPAGPAGPPGETVVGPQGPPGESITGPAGPAGVPGAAPASLTFVAGGVTYTCTDPDGDLAYQCAATVTEPIGGTTP